MQYVYEAVERIVAARESAAATRARAEGEQAGREDNADHDMCYVHGSEALAARDAEMRAEGAAEALRQAADEWPWHDAGETWLRDRAARIVRSES
ncbi:hypothetical protein L2K70_04845 [Nocardioides KLBMP 9356]|uniref:Uncharacterized protein n=1 Tax=Nocardioides potassii TaxID=2911371 RepID=A0ABS9HA05_9ACTN|nr:hypothetical protein [Nocardioides potassii]MCF6376923.1 hypothetical protein [Nocardioides potassii]